MGLYVLLCSLFLTDVVLAQFLSMQYYTTTIFLSSQKQTQQSCAFPFLFSDREQSFLDANASGPLLLSSSSISTAPASRVVHEHHAGAQHTAWPCFVDSNIGDERHSSS